MGGGCDDKRIEMFCEMIEREAERSDMLAMFQNVHLASFNFSECTGNIFCYSHLSEQHQPE